MEEQRLLGRDNVQRNDNTSSSGRQFSALRRSSLRNTFCKVLIGKFYFFLFGWGHIVTPPHTDKMEIRNTRHGKTHEPETWSSRKDLNLIGFHIRHNWSVKQCQFENVKCRKYVNISVKNMRSFIPENPSHGPSASPKSLNLQPTHSTPRNC